MNQRFQLLLLLFIFALASCKKDKNGPISIAGKWYWEKMQSGLNIYTDINPQSYFEFKENGAFIEFSVEQGNRSILGTYKVVGNKISIKREIDETGTDWTVKKLDAENLIISRGDLEYTFSRKTGKPTSFVEITVMDASGRSQADPKASTSSGASVFIFLSETALQKNKPDYQGKTSASGICKIQVPDREKLYLTVTNGNAAITNSGYLINGIFTSIEDINNHPIQANAQIGSLIFVDIDGDGAITSSDKASSYEFYSGKKNETVKRTVYISN